MDSLDSSMKPSQSKVSGGSPKSGKPKRRKVSRTKSEQGRDTAPQSTNLCHPSVSSLSREERILVYMSRVWENPKNSKCKKIRVGKNNLPLNVLTGEEYTAKELEVEE